MHTFTLAGNDDWAGFVALLHACLRDGIGCDDVEWRVAALPEERATAPARRAVVSHLPKTFLDIARVAMLHSSPTRFILVHRLAQRIVDAPDAWRDTLHPDHVTLMALHRQVRREMHKMKAFVRFTKVADGDGERFVAWFEPAHAIVRAVAPFFARRFAGMRWAIATPDLSVQWDGNALAFGPGGRRDQAPPPDAGEVLWLTYYQRIFNPARVKVQAMKKEMPVRYWPLLPEARLIAPLLADAGRRTHEMVALADTCRDRRAATVAGERGAAPLTRMQRLRQRAASCSECEFSADATQIVWGEGPGDARIVIVGEQPGDREDLVGRPFVGPAGQLLRQALEGAGIDAAQVYLTNAVKHFKYQWRGKRRMHKTAAQRESEACSAWLDEELKIIDPEVVLALGVTAASSLLGRSVRLREVVGGPLRTKHGLPMIVAEHPSSLLRRQVTVGSPAFGAWVETLRGVHAHA